MTDFCKQASLNSMPQRAPLITSRWDGFSGQVGNISL